jgi:hypothetical protein
MRRPVPWLLAGVLFAATACLAFVLLRPVVEAEALARLQRAARRAGLSATVGSVHLTPWLSLELGDVVLENPGRVRVMTRSATVRPRLSLRVPPGRAARVSHASAVVEFPAGLRLELAPAAWALDAASTTLSVRRIATGERLEIDLRSGPAVRAELQARAANARPWGLVGVRFRGCPVADPGTVDGELRLEREREGAVRVVVRGRARALAVAAWTTGGGEGCDDAMGAPTDAELEAEARADTRTGSLRVDRLRIAAGGAELQARLAVEGGASDPRVDLHALVPRVDFARLLATAGLDRPAEDLVWASLEASVAGPLLDAAALRVEERLDFHPPARPLPAIERLKGPFTHQAESRDGTTTVIRVEPDSPDFVPLAEVPPLLVKMVLIGEDANFYGHRGADLKEIPVALASDFASGSFARGASTIPQQLAKNLFLSREKTLSRKIEELALALLLDASLGKDRELEIYLNLIEWGPRLYGLRPAARRYFGREPGELAPRQMAFLVALVPGPLRYQRSFAGGVPSPFLEGRIATLLAKLRSVGALSEPEYEQALRGPLDLLIPGPADEKGAPAPGLP